MNNNEQKQTSAQSQNPSNAEITAALKLALESGKKIEALANSIVYQNALVSRELKSAVATQLSHLYFCLQLTNPTEAKADERSESKTDKTV